MKKETQASETHVLSTVIQTHTHSHTRACTNIAFATWAPCPTSLKSYPISAR